MKKIVLISLVLVGCGGEGTGFLPPGPTPVATPDNGINPPIPPTPVNECESILPEVKFYPGIPEGWKKAKWFNTDNLPTEGEIISTLEGVVFKSVDSNANSNLVYILEKDVSSCGELVFAMEGKALNQTLEGTGRDAREAPLHFVLEYTDMKGVKHNTLTAYNGGEVDDRGTTRMFWRGFIINEGYNYGDEGGIITPYWYLGENDYVRHYEVLKDIKIIHRVMIGGSGWKEREGVVRSLEISKK